MSLVRAAASHLKLVPGATGRLPQYMHRRAGIYYFKRKVPADAREAFPYPGGQVWKSLDTNLLTVAKVRLAVEVTEFNLTLAAYRRQRAAAIAAQRAGPAVLQNAGQPVLSVVKGRAAEAEDLSQGAKPSKPPMEQASPLDCGQNSDQGSPANEQSALLERLRFLEAELERMRSKSTSEAAPGAAAVLPTSAALSTACSTQSNAAIPDRAVVHGSGAAGNCTMLHLFEDWKQTQTRPRTINAVETAVLEFRELHGPVAVEAISRSMARAYRDQLLERGLARGTIENKLGFLSTLVRHGMSELVEHLAANPFERIEIVGATGIKPPKERRAYEVSELNKVFASRLYTGGYRPEGQSKDAAYWLPLLGPFVGARIEELCQLAVKDIQRINGVWCLRICNLDDDQNVKNDGSFRRVPLHEEVIASGFLAYVAGVAAAGHSRVFPTLRNNNANRIYSNSPGKWWGRYLDSIGLSDQRLDYHSFRYSFKQQCTLCGIETEVRDALTGHWVSNNDSGRAYMRAEARQYPFPKLVAAIKQLRYEELRTSHLHVERPLEGVDMLIQ